MKRYFFSIFVRGFTAISGFLVFVVTSKLFGAEGRGIISYGTSIFASIALIASFNLGRGFIVKTQKDENLRQQNLFSFLILNYLAILLTAVLGLAFVLTSHSAEGILGPRLVLPLLITSAFYVWSINGNSIFAAFQLTTVQERVILLTRLTLTAFLAAYVVAGDSDIQSFLWWYAGILVTGVAFEWLLLRRYIKSFVINWKSLWPSIKQSAWPHLDYVCFHIFPLMLILISGVYLEKSGIGRVNFAIQIINLIFLLSTTASIRINSYISTVGFRQRISNIKKLLFATLAASFVSAVMVIPIIEYLTNLGSFSSFDGVEKLFIVSIAAIPGYVSYQFLTPLWLEDNLIKLSGLLHLVNLVVITLITPIMISSFQEMGAIYCFSLFHLGCLVVQLWVFRTMRKTREAALRATTALSTNV